MGQSDMAEVMQKCKEVLRSMEEASRAEGKDHCKRCRRLILEHDLALKEIEVVNGAGAFSPALTELLRIMFDGKRLVSDCLSSTERKSAESNSLSLETSFCLHVRKLYACVSVLKCVDAEAAGKETAEKEAAGELTFEYGPSTENEVKAKVRRMQEICSKFLGGKKRKADVRKICVDELDFQKKEEFCMGAFGPVLKCSWSTETVAVKMLPGVQEGLVRSEALRLVGLQHPYLVKVIGYGFDDTKNTGFLVMEFLERSLETFLQKWSGGDSERASCPFTVALPILSEVAMAVNDLRKRVRDHDNAHFNISIRNVFVVSNTGVEESNMPEDHYVHAKLIPTSTIVKPDSVQNSSDDVSEFALMGVQILGDGKDIGGLGLSTFLTSYLKRCLDRNPEGRPSFPEICEMLQLCTNIGTRGIYFPSRFFSVNKVYAKKLYKLLGLECFTSTIAENGSFSYPEIFLEVLVHALHELPSTNFTELKSAEWKERLLRASRCFGGYWTTPSLRISDPLIILDAIEKNLEGEAIWRLGLCYELGSVVDVNEAKAVSMYESASAQGFVSANVDLGLCFAFGKGVQEDLQRANELWTEAIKYQVKEKKPLASMSVLVQSLRIMLSKSDGSEQKRATSVGEFVQLVKTILFGNTNRSKDSATLEISSRILKLSQKSADLGPQLVAGPSCCNIAELLELRGKLIVDDILRHLAERSATIKEYLLEHQAAIPVSHTATLRGIAAMGWQLWLRDRCTDGLKLFWAFIVFIISIYASIFMAFAIPVGMAAYFSTSSTPSFWLAGVSLLALPVTYWTLPWILKSVAIYKLISPFSNTVPNSWYRILKAVILGKPERLSTGPSMPNTFWEACRQSPLVGMTEDDPDCLTSAELFKKVFEKSNEVIPELSAHILSRDDESHPPQYRLVPLREVVGPHIPDDHFKSADRWELDNLGETSELKEHVEHRARRSISLELGLPEMTRRSESSDIDRRWALVRADSQDDTLPGTAGDRPTNTDKNETSEGIEKDPTISGEGLTFVLLPKSQLLPPYRLASVQEVIDNRNALFDAMPGWEIASLADGSVEGKLYGGRIGVERDDVGDHLAIKDPSIPDVGQPTFKLFPVSDQLPQQYRLVTVQEVNDNLAALFEAMLEVRPPQREVAHLADGTVVGKRFRSQRNLTRPVKLPNVDYQLATLGAEATAVGEDTLQSGRTLQSGWSNEIVLVNRGRHNRQRKAGFFVGKKCHFRIQCYKNRSQRR